MLANGFTRVGASFPVFLKNGEEYALARKERKTGVGYKGFDVIFDPSVTLEEDLSRRDLTINSMAMDLDTGEVIDPFGGRHDLAQGVLRATSDAFAEDPVRILRTARFAARYGFTIAEDTSSLMHTIAGELFHVPRERIWMEFEKGLAEPFPGKMMDALEESHAMWVAPLLPYRCWSRLLRDVTQDDGMDVRFALLAFGFSTRDYEWCKIPTHLARVSKSVSKHIDFIMKYDTLGAIARLFMLKELRAIHDPSILNVCLRVATLLAKYDTMYNLPAAMARIAADLEKLRSLDCSSIVANRAPNQHVRDVIEMAQLAAIS
jgi:tRNA nucleotidyltransferase/poly(A) polymerase